MHAKLTNMKLYLDGNTEEKTVTSEVEFCVRLRFLDVAADARHCKLFLGSVKSAYLREGLLTPSEFVLFRPISSSSVKIGLTYWNKTGTQIILIHQNSKFFHLKLILYASVKDS